MKPKFIGDRLCSVNIQGVAAKSSSRPGKNSGAGALILAASRFADKIIMLGYDCKTGHGGKKHWHGDHKKGLGNAGKLPEWPGQFKECLRSIGPVDIVNCSRDTALNVFRLGSLEDELC